MQLKRTAWLLVLSLCVWALPAMKGSAEEVEKTNQDFVVSEQGVITEYLGDKETISLTVPTTQDGVTITGIGEHVFENLEKLETVVIPDAITSIGDFAFFNCPKWNTMRTYSQEDISEETGEIPEKEGSKYIIEIPASLEQLGMGAFAGCTSISNFQVPENQEYFSTYAVTDGEEVSTKGELLLSKDQTILQVCAPAHHYTGQGPYPLMSGIVEIADYACYMMHTNGSVFMPNTVQTIGNYSFYQCGNLNTIEFEENSTLASIGAYAFANNANLRIELPESVEKIGPYCFSSCQNLKINIEKTKITELPLGTFFECDNLKDVATDKAVVVMPETLQTIGDKAFYGCNNLNEVTFLGKTLSGIGTSAFDTCGNLHIINIPEGVTTIEADTFHGCGNLQDVGLPQSLVSIKEEAFADCRNIQNMVIPESVKEIAADSFNGARKENIDTSKNQLAQRLIPGSKFTPTYLGVGGSFTVGGITFKVTKSAGRNSEVAAIALYAKSVKKVTINATVLNGGLPYKVTAIGDNAFKKATNLSSITIGSNLTQIGKSAFEGCKKLKKITIKSSKLKKVGKKAIKGIHKKATIKVPKKKIKKYKKLFKKAGLKKSMKVKK